MTVSKEPFPGMGARNLNAPCRSCGTVTWPRSAKRRVVLSTGLRAKSVREVRKNLQTSSGSWAPEASHSTESSSTAGSRGQRGRERIRVQGIRVPGSTTRFPPR